MFDVKIEDFFNTDYVDSASYDNLRKVSSYIDGLKNSSRKVVHTILDKNVNKKSKVSRLQSSVSEHTEYLHGEDNIASVIVNLCQNFTGSNNIPLLQRNGNFGERFTPVASASRYIYTQKEEYLDNLFDKLDSEILPSQQFEGVDIEPRFFVPILPMLILNGSEGVSIGFSQKILPRSPKQVVSELKKVLKGRKKLVNVDMGIPYWKGFEGEVVKDEEKEDKWLIYGKYEWENMNTMIITELPINYDLKKYLKVLDKLQENGDIKSYKDLSEDDKFKFKVKVSRDFHKKYEKKSAKKFKLVKPLTENYTCIDEDNKIRIFDSIEEIFQSYYNLRLHYYDLRKENILKNLSREVEVLNSKYEFIKNIVDGKIKVNNKPKKDIIKQLDTFDTIIKVDDSYDYLLRMPIYSLTKERLDDISKKIKGLKKEVDDLSGKSLEELWLDDIDKLELEF